MPETKGAHMTHDFSKRILSEHGILLLDRDFLDTSAVIARNKGRRKRLDRIRGMLQRLGKHRTLAERVKLT